MNFAALKTELLTDPAGRGYAALIAAGNHQGLADSLNTQNTTIDQEFIESYQLLEAIVPAEWDALAAQERERVRVVLGLQKIRLKGTNTRAALSAAFGGGTTTRANVSALMTRPASRAEVVLGAGATVTPADIAIALK